jgi:CelD/BcsL family acetyltransferase involved in cellulose biosynthesis
MPEEGARENGLERSGLSASPQWVQKFLPTAIERSQEGQKARLQTLHWPSRISAVQWGQYFIQNESKAPVIDKAKQSI